ncbi:hypothetical protein ACOMCU_12575 [Lysinibacillus sp. UGB7]|uniref:hypothetical protein n=1 Tax=Lysinibacillus sp. UGB7 TaxID=3411039 RepID=UPI003B8082BE
MDYFKSKAFEKHRKNTYSLLEQIPYANSPVGWTFKGNFSIGGFEYFGFDESSDLLLVVSSNGRGIIDLAKAEKIARDDTDDFDLDETLLICEGFDVLKDKSIKLASKYGGSILPIRNKFGECLRRVSPLFPCEDIIYEPALEDCFVEGQNISCVRIYRGFLYCYGFSYSGNYFVIADDGGILFWERH